MIDNIEVFCDKNNTEENKENEINEDKKNEISDEIDKIYDEICKLWEKFVGYDVGSYEYLCGIKLYEDLLDKYKDVYPKCLQYGINHFYRKKQICIKNDHSDHYILNTKYCDTIYDVKISKRCEKCLKYDKISFKYYKKQIENGKMKDCSYVADMYLYNSCNFEDGSIKQIKNYSKVEKYCLLGINSNVDEYIKDCIEIILKYYQQKYKSDDENKKISKELALKYASIGVEKKHFFSIEYMVEYYEENNLIKEKVKLLKNNLDLNNNYIFYQLGLHYKNASNETDKSNLYFLKVLNNDNNTNYSNFINKISDVESDYLKCLDHMNSYYYNHHSLESFEYSLKYIQLNVFTQNINIKNYHKYITKDNEDLFYHIMLRYSENLTKIFHDLPDKHYGISIVTFIYAIKSYKKLLFLEINLKKYLCSDIINIISNYIPIPKN